MLESIIGGVVDGCRGSYQCDESEEIGEDSDSDDLSQVLPCPLNIPFVVVR